jgi:tetratricopeptide (TPR) repeat protein
VLAVSRGWFPFRVLGLFLILSCTLALAQDEKVPDKPTQDDTARRQAEEFYQQGKFVAAMPLFEKLSADHPSDVVMKERWAWCLMQYSGTLPDIEQRKKTRVQARAIGLQAKELGDNSQLLQMLLELPEDGSEPKFSDRKEVDETMRAAEADFSRGDLDKAREGYMRAMLLDPGNYDAALFTGDVFFKQHLNGNAGEWFARAVQIDPNRETAYRYWGDALVALGKDDDARSKYIEAVVADPYNRRSSVGLTNWLQRNKLALNTVHLKDGAAVTQKDEKNINITLDSSLGKDDPNGPAWMMYAMGRASWRGDKFKKEFPNELKYRRTLKEEADCLGLMITILKEQKDYARKLKKLDPSLQALIKIQEEGFLEPFVLFSRADTEIAQDYEPYRAAHRENIRRYLDEFVVPKTPVTASK